MSDTEIVLDSLRESLNEIEKTHQFCIDSSEKMSETLIETDDERMQRIKAKAKTLFDKIFEFGEDSVKILNEYKIVQAFTKYYMIDKKYEPVERTACFISKYHFSDDVVVEKYMIEMLLENFGKYMAYKIGDVHYTQAYDAGAKTLLGQIDFLVVSEPEMT